MENLENLSNNEILFHVKQLQADHEAIKIRMLKDLDELEKTEKKFEEANKILLKRLKGET